jgi:hypothetical protein
MLTRRRRSTTRCCRISSIRPDRMTPRVNWAAVSRYIAVRAAGLAVIVLAGPRSCSGHARLSRRDALCGTAHAGSMAVRRQQAHQLGPDAGRAPACFDAARGLGRRAGRSAAVPRPAGPGIAGAALAAIVANG